MQGVLILTEPVFAKGAHNLIFRRKLKLKIPVHKAGCVFQQHIRLNEITFKKWECDFGNAGDLDRLIAVWGGS